MPSTKGCSGPGTTRLTCSNEIEPEYMRVTYFLLHGKLDEFFEVIRGNVGNVGGVGLAGGAWVPRTDEDVLDRRRLRKFPGEGVLPSAAADEEDTDGHDKMKKVELPNRDRRSDGSVDILQCAWLGASDVAPCLRFALLVLHGCYMRFLHDVAY